MQLIPDIPSIDDSALAARLQSRIDGKTKPLGALGRLEALALRLGLGHDSMAVTSVSGIAAR